MEEAEIAVSEDDEIQPQFKRKTVTFVKDLTLETESEAESEKASVKLKSPAKR